jgi:hypothetical protein
MDCFYCHATGHKVASCPQLQKKAARIEQQHAALANTTCFGCGELGHLKRECPEQAKKAHKAQKDKRQEKKEVARCKLCLFCGSPSHVLSQCTHRGPVCLGDFFSTVKVVKVPFKKRLQQAHVAAPS